MTTRIAKQFSAARRRDVVDVTSEDSFPASDPPAWVSVAGTGAPSEIETEANQIVTADVADRCDDSRALVGPTKDCLGVKRTARRVSSQVVRQ